MIYLISYDLTKPNRDYKALHDAIKKYANWARPLESVWLIESSDDRLVILNKLRAVMDADDKIIVVGLNGKWAVSATIDTKVTDWLTNKLP